MPNRMIKSRARTSSIQLAECLASLLALELMAPSPVLYLISPWITDMPLIRNHAGQYRAIMPEMSKDVLSLADVLTALAERDVQIRIISRADHQLTEYFIRKLPLTVERITSATLHEKGLVSEQFYLRGSMNFTFSGVNLNDESIELTTDQTAVATALIEAQQRWEEIGA
jgi:hypothetical protein